MPVTAPTKISTLAMTPAMTPFNQTLPFPDIDPFTSNCAFALERVVYGTAHRKPLSRDQVAGSRILDRLCFGISKRIQLFGAK